MGVLGLAILFAGLLTGNSIIECMILGLLCPGLLWLVQKAQRDKMYDVHSVVEKHEQCVVVLRKWFLFETIVFLLWASIAGLGLMNVVSNEYVLSRNVGREKAAELVSSVGVAFVLYASLFVINLFGYMAFRRDYPGRLFAFLAVGEGVVGMVGTLTAVIQASAGKGHRALDILPGLFTNPFFYTFALLLWAAFTLAACQFLVAKQRLSAQEAQDELEREWKKLQNSSEVVSSKASPPAEFRIDCPHCGQTMIATAAYSCVAICCPTCNSDFVAPEIG
ncbi:MAG TPA: hypothetical protein DDZ88_11220 [Verrucomicrobiales bacterium]|nr:hypothetical protein [Verrucomicrobiales bacterium]